MLKITKKVEYALIAVRHLKENPKDLVPVSEISNIYGIPRELLAKTMQQLASKNILKSNTREIPESTFDIDFYANCFENMMKTKK